MKSDSFEHAAPEVKVNLADRDQLLKLAKLYLDSPYQLGATGSLPGNPTDCSKFTQNVFGNAGIELERSSADQAHQFSNGGYWYDTLEQAEIGDLLFFKDTYDTGDGREITHVGIYAGNNTMIHAGTKKVEISILDSYWKGHFKGIGSFKYFAHTFNPEKAKKNYLALNGTPQSQGLPSTPTLPPVLPTAPVAEVQHASAPQLISLDASRLDAVGKKFFEEWQVQLQGDHSTQLKKGESRTFTLEITKANGDKFNGILKQPIILVANSTNISLEPVAITLVKEGKVEIKLTAHQSGPVYTAINMGTNRMGGMSMQVM